MKRAPAKSPWLAALLLSLALCASPAEAGTIALFDAYLHADGTTRYVAVLSDSSIYYYAPKFGWSKVKDVGLPKHKAIKHLSAFTKRGQGSRYVVALVDQSLHWFNAKTGWAPISTKGLPAGYRVKALRGFEGGDGKTRYVTVLAKGEIYYFVVGHETWTKTSKKGLPPGRGR